MKNVPSALVTKVDGIRLYKDGKRKGETRKAKKTYTTMVYLGKDNIDC